MGKPFFEVFPSLKLEQKIHDIMEQAEIEKVSSTKKKDFLRIYIKSSRLIAKEDIWYTEQAIKDQLFPNIGMIIKFYERFELSAQYTPQKLMDAYGIQGFGGLFVEGIEGDYFNVVGFPVAKLARELKKLEEER